MENSKDTKTVEKKSLKTKAVIAAGGFALALGGALGIMANKGESDTPTSPTTTEVPTTAVDTQPDNGETGGVIVTEENPDVNQPAVSTTAVDTQPDDGEPGGVIVTQDNPGVNQPATPDAELKSDQGPTSVIVTPENPTETETPVTNG